MAMKEYSAFPKVPELCLTIRWFRVISRTFVEGVGASTHGRNAVGIIYLLAWREKGNLDKKNSWVNFIFNFLIILIKLINVGWGCRIHRLHLYRKINSPNESPGYDTKQSDAEVPVMLEFWGMQRIPSLPLLPGPLWPRVVAPDRVLSMGQIELNCNYAKLNCLKSTIYTFNCF